MHFLVVATPRGDIDPERLPEMLEAAIAWYDRHEDEFEAFGTFVGGGGFGVVDVADQQELNQLMLEMPFSPYSNIEVRPFAVGAAGLRQAKVAFEAMAAASS